MPYVAIIQPPETDGLVPTQGTKVMVGGVELEGVYKIEITGEVNDAWRAVIHVHPKMVQMTTLADTSMKYFPSLRQKLLMWWHGIR